VWIDYILPWCCSSLSIDLNVLTGLLFYFCVSLFFLSFLCVSCCHWRLVVTDQWPIAGGGWCAGAIWSKFVPTAELIIVSFPSTRTSPASDGYRPARKHQKRPVSKTSLFHYWCRLGGLAVYRVFAISVFSNQFCVDLCRRIQLFVYATIGFNNATKR